MSILKQLGDEFQNVPQVLQIFEEEFARIELDLKMKGKSLDQLLIEQSSLLGYYDLRQVEVRSIRKAVEARIDKIRAVYWRYYTENHPRELNYRDKEHYVNNEAKLVDLKHLLLEVTEMEDKYKAACDAMKQKGFMLNALVKARVATLDNLTL